MDTSLQRPLELLALLLTSIAKQKERDAESVASNGGEGNNYGQILP